MRSHRSTAAVLFVLALTSLAGCGQNGPVEDYAPAGGGFTVTPPPGAPDITIQKQKIQSEVGEIELTMHVWDMGSKAVMISVNEYPKKFWDVADPKAALDGGQTKAVGDGKLISSKDTVVNGLKARDFIFEKSVQGTTMTCRDVIILAKPKMYQVLCLGTSPDYVTSDGINTTFNSFKLTK